MNTMTNKESRSAIYELIAAIVLGVLAIASFAAQAYWFDEKTTQRETVLFSTLQFLLTLGFGWFSTRAVSRVEFERSLKQFAIGAYRRITDIEAMVQRLRERLLTGQGTVGSTSYLEVVDSVLEDTLQVVRSSTADWADVIGDELLVLQAIKNLRLEKTELEVAPALEESAPSADQKKAKDIDARIETLTNKLPPNLQIESRLAEEDQRSRDHVAEWMRQLHTEEKGMRLRVVAGGMYRCDGDLAQLGRSTELELAIERSGGVNIRDSNNVILGRVLNNTPLDYKAFTRGIVDCFGKKRLPVQFLKQVGRRQDENEIVCWYDVQILAEPLPSHEEPHIGTEERAEERPTSKRVQIKQSAGTSEVKP